MKRIGSLMMADLKLVRNNIFFWVLAGMLIVIILVVNFVLPDELNDKSPDIITYGFEIQGRRRADTLEQLKELASRDEHVVGIALDNGGYTVYGDHLNKKQAAALILPFAERTDRTVPVMVSQTGSPVNVPPFNKRCLPVFICFEAVVQGFLLAGILMLNDKSGNMARALQVSPVGALHYWMEKVLLFSILGSGYALLMAIFTVGFHFPIVPFILVSALASTMFTMLGMMTAAFFRSLNNWLMVASLILGINTLTLFAYIMPSLSFPFMRFIPSYPLIFVFEQILFGDLKLTPEMVPAAVWTALLGAASLFCVKGRWLRPQKGGWR